VRRALYASKIVAYAQGFDQIAAGSEEYEWGIDPGAMATIWRGGCIIRARFLDRVRVEYDTDPGLPSLLLAPSFVEALADAQDAWRRVVATAASLGVPSSSRGCATCSAPTRIAGSTRTGRSTRVGRRTGPRGGSDLTSGRFSVPADVARVSLLADRRWVARTRRRRRCRPARR
jgi:hypothetical protein